MKSVKDMNGVLLPVRTSTRQRKSQSPGSACLHSALAQYAAPRPTAGFAL